MAPAPNTKQVKAACHNRSLYLFRRFLHASAPGAFVSSDMVFAGTGRGIALLIYELFMRFHDEIMAMDVDLAEPNK